MSQPALRPSVEEARAHADQLTIEIELAIARAEAIAMRAASVANHGRLLAAAARAYGRREPSVLPGRQTATMPKAAG